SGWCLGQTYIIYLICNYLVFLVYFLFFFSSRRRHTRFSRDWSSDVCSSDLSPMATYSAKDGCPTDFHLVHYGTRAEGGAGLVYTEMTCVSPEGRITPGCAGMYAPEHVAAWKRIVDFVHAHSRARFCLQLGHARSEEHTSE